MKRVFLLIALALTSARGIDFAPREVKAVGEGGEYSYLRFSDGEKAVTYNPPKYWSFRGRGAVFRLDPVNITGAECEISYLAMETPLVASEANLQTFEALALESLPPGATKIETETTTFNPCELDGQKTVEVTISCVLFGQPLKISRLYLTRKEDMLRFTVLTKPGDFEQVRQTFHASLHTLAGL
jgi:hypothetical protein